MGKRRGYKKPRDGRSKTFAADPAICHLCLLPIPPRILSGDHPLYGTIDHVIPLSRGGRDTFDNRAPAHSFCNNRKRNDIDVDAGKRVSWTGVIAPMLIRAGVKCSNQMVKDARGKITKLGGFYKYDIGPDLFRWDDDGGAVYQRPHWRKPLPTNSTR